MADDVVNIKVCSPLKLYSCLTVNSHEICHYSYNFPVRHNAQGQNINIMKKNIIFTVISILSFQFLIAQNYIPLAVEGAHWVIRYDKMETIEPVDGLWEYYSTGDTTINQIDYKKVYKRELVITQDGPPFESEGPYQLYGLIRDDTMNRKVYAIKYNALEGCPENEEYLLYDFSINIGDSLELCIIPDWNEFVVTDIYSQEVLGFNTTVYYDWDEIYEGMGSSYGLFEEMFAPFKKSTERYIYCTFLEFYCRESPCWLFVSTPEKLETESINLFPNPAHDFIYVSTENEDINSISIFNKVGQEVIRKSGDLNKIDVRELNPGLYIFELTMNKTRIQRKIIIE